MAFSWANVLVAPTGSSALDTGDHTSVGESPPWDDGTTAASILVSSLATETPIFTGFDLSLAGGEKKSFYIWSRMLVDNAAGFTITIVLKQDTTTLWTSDPFTITNTAYRTFQIPVPDSAFVGSDIDNLSLEWTCQNLLAGNNRVRWTFLRISKTPFTTAQEAVLPSTLDGQEFVCYRASDIGVLGGADAESVLLIPDASGGGRHAVLKTDGATYETDAPEGLLASTGRFVGSLGYDTATEAIITWSNNLILHTKVYPTSAAAETAIVSGGATEDFIGATIAGQKHLLGILVAGPDWVIMHGDGSGPAHLSGGTATTSVEHRITQWVQASGNEHLWENDDASPAIDDASGANALYSWSLLNRESDDRPLVGRLMEWWAVEGTGITEADIDSARDEWVNGPPEPPADMISVTIHRSRRIRVR